MAKAFGPLFSIEAYGQLGKVLIYRKGGVVSKYFIPRDPKTPAQLAQREKFLEFVMAGLTKEEADLLYAAIVHGHDHGTMDDLGDDDHQQYYNQARGDARYLKIGDVVSAMQFFPTQGQTGQVPAGATRYLNPVVFGLQTAQSQIAVPVPGSIGGLAVKTNTPQPGTGTLVVTLLKDGFETGHVLTIPAGAAAGDYLSGAGYVDYLAGQSFGYKLVNNALSDSARIIPVSSLIVFA